MKYLVCRKQEGEGCDYTIGCGMRFGYYEADTVEDLIEEISYPDGREESCALLGEQELTELLIVPFNYIRAIDIEQLKSDARLEEANCELKEEEEKDRKELARLQEKLK